MKRYITSLKLEVYQTHLSEAVTNLLLEEWIYSEKSTFAIINGVKTRALKEGFEAAIKNIDEDSSLKSIDEALSVLPVIPSDLDNLKLSPCYYYGATDERNDLKAKATLQMRLENYCVAHTKEGTRIEFGKTEMILFSICWDIITARTLNQTFKLMREEFVRELYWTEREKTDWQGEIN